LSKSAIRVVHTVSRNQLDFTVFIVSIDKRWTTFKIKSKHGRRATNVIIELFNGNNVHLLYFICLLPAIAL
jgi:hypothetical protein